MYLEASDNKNDQLYSEKCKEVWETNTRFLPLPFEVRKDGAIPRKGKQIIDVTAELSSIFGPVIVYMEKRNKQGEWVLSTLTKDHFKVIKDLNKQAFI